MATKKRTASATPIDSNKKEAKRQKPAPALKRKTDKPAAPPKLKANESVFDGMRDVQLAESLAYYSNNPNLLPRRKSEAEKRIKNGQLPYEIKVEFDEDIFTRSKPLRPIPDHEKDGIDPFNIDFAHDDCTSHEDMSPGSGLGDGKLPYAVTAIKQEKGMDIVKHAGEEPSLGISWKIHGKKRVP